jgi:hypothetical protein
MSSPSARNHNPGNVRWSEFAKTRGAIEAPGNMAHWESNIQGLASMLTLLSFPSYRVLSLKNAINRYAPSADHNDPSRYSGFVSHRSGVDEGRRLDSLDPFEILRVIEAMIKFEGWEE